MGISETNLQVANLEDHSAIWISPQKLSSAILKMKRRRSLDAARYDVHVVITAHVVQVVSHLALKMGRNAHLRVNISDRDNKIQKIED